MSNEQTPASGADAQGKPGAEATGAAVDPVDAALKEFENASGGTKTNGATDAGTATEPKITDDDVAYLRQRRQQDQRDAFQRDIASAVKTVKGDELDTDDEVIEGLLYARAEKDERLRVAFAQRQQKPAEWQAVLKALGKELQGKLGPKVDAAATEDRDAVRAALRSSATRSPQPTDAELNRKIAPMGLGQFNRWKEEQGLTSKG